MTSKKVEKLRMFCVFYGFEGGAPQSISYPAIDEGHARRVFQEKYKARYRYSKRVPMVLGVEVAR